MSWLVSARWIGFLTMTAGAVARCAACGRLFLVCLQYCRRRDHSSSTTPTASWCSPARPRAFLTLSNCLAAERGKRLLITGVHRATSAREIARLTPLYSKYLHLLHRSRPLGAQHLRQRAGNQTLGARAQFQFADRGDVELAHAARHGRARRINCRTPRSSPFRSCRKRSRLSPGGPTLTRRASVRGISEISVRARPHAPRPRHAV